MRLIPVALAVAFLMLSLRVGDIWFSLSGGEVAESERPTAGRALAQSEADPADALDEGAAGEGAPANGAADPAAPPPGMAPLPTTDEAAPDFQTEAGDLRPGELRLMHDLAKRREKLDQRERRVEEREALLAAAEQRLVTKQQQLEQLRQEIEELVARYDQNQEEETNVLRQTYETMKPKDAAAILNDLEIDILLDVVRGMSARRLAPILAAMNPEKARTVTEELALREELPNLGQ
ncbi:MAG: hypothetical protein RIB45_14020 [Marivibrio sp.]|uniref:MotE family protein n=1 Tax=Marivibrio sp. TaxID=2039719 RepID=UPI0032EF24D1